MIARGLGVGWIPSILADDDSRIVVRPVAGPVRLRDIYVLIPPGERHRHVDDVLAALREAAREYGVPARAAMRAYGYVGAGGGGGVPPPGEGVLSG